MKNKGFKIAKALTAFTQISLSVLMPVALCIFLAKLTVTKLGWPEFTVVIGIVLGAVSGFYNMIKFMLALNKNNKSE